jgi:hypothetical protein
MPTFADYESSELAPGWLRDPWGAALLKARGAQKDWLADALKQGVKARMPGAAPLDALPLIGRERGITRGRTETVDSYRARLRGAWEAWRWAGTPYGMLLAFYWAGYRPTAGRVAIQTQGDAVAGGRQFTLRADFDPTVHTPENALVIADLGVVHLGGSPAELWPDFAVLFVGPILSAWIPTPPVDGSDEVDGIRDLISRWKPGHARCVKLVVAGGPLWGYPGDDHWNSYPGQTWAQVGAGISATWTPPAG